MGPINSEDYLKIYHETGIDVDGRGQLIQEALDIMEPLVRKMVEYYKGFPGFRSLPLEDQVAILKGMSFLCCNYVIAMPVQLSRPDEEHNSKCIAC